MQTYEGQRDLTLWRGRVLSLGFGQGEDLVMNSHYQTVATVAGGNGLPADLHDFQLAPNDVAYITAYNPIRCDLSPVNGRRDGAILDAAIQEIDMKTGLVRWEWHSLDHVGAGESEVERADGDRRRGTSSTSTRSTPSPAATSSSRRATPGPATRSQAGTGRILWRLGGNRSSFKMGPGTRRRGSTTAAMLPDGEVTFFDDGSNPPIHTQSRAVRDRARPQDARSAA